MLRGDQVSPSAPLPDVRHVDAVSSGGLPPSDVSSEPLTAIVIGNFDGVHRGHAAVLAQMSALASARKLSPSVLTFDPHPALVLGKGAPQTLTTLERKIELFGQHGVARVFVARFSRAFAETSPEAFARFVFNDLGAKVVVVGSDFRFGKGRAGDFGTLMSSAKMHGVEAFAAVLEVDHEGPISSTRVRRALASGNVGHAQELLGRAHSFSGEVIHGAKKGRTIGFPTVNLDGIEEACPTNGVYAVSVDQLDPAPHDDTRSDTHGASRQGRPARALAHGVMNIGTRPTVDGEGTTRHVEVFLFDFEGDLYGATLRVHVRARVRDEKRFPSFDELKAQIAADADRARELTAAIAVPTEGSFDSPRAHP